jgi:hypothetical protein
LGTSRLAALGLRAAKAAASHDMRTTENHVENLVLEIKSHLNPLFRSQTINQEKIS